MNISSVKNAQVTYVNEIDKKNISKEAGKSTLKGASIPVKDSFEKEGEKFEAIGYQPPKKLTQDQISELKQERIESSRNLIREMVEKNITNQGNLFHNSFELTSESVDLLTSIFGSLEAALPTPAVTKEGALADISEGGAYSVEAVSERIMKMATSLAGGNPQILAEMEHAVKKGFESAGLNLETGEGMPAITMETYNHVMEQFSNEKARLETVKTEL